MEGRGRRRRGRGGKEQAKGRTRRRNSQKRGWIRQQRPGSGVSTRSANSPPLGAPVPFGPSVVPSSNTPCVVRRWQRIQIVTTAVVYGPFQLLFS